MMRVSCLTAAWCWMLTSTQMMCQSGALDHSPNSSASTTLTSGHMLTSTARKSAFRYITLHFMFMGYFSLCSFPYPRLVTRSSAGLSIEGTVAQSLLSRVYARGSRRFLIYSGVTNSCWTQYLREDKKKKRRRLVQCLSSPDWPQGMVLAPATRQLAGHSIPVVNQAGETSLYLVCRLALSLWCV